MKNISKYKVEYGILIPLIIFAIISITTVYSAQNLLPEYSSNLYLKQLIWYVLGFGIAYFIMFIGNKFLYNSAYILYVINVILLILILFFGKEVNNSKCWFELGFFSLQPSEFMKVILILTLSRMINDFNTEYDNPSVETEFKFILKVMLIVFIPSVLTFIEPDTGAVIIYLVTTMTMLFIGGIRKRWFFSLFLIIFVFLGILFAIYFINQDLFISIFGTNFFYRIDRILNWSSGSGGQLTNSLIAIGSAGVLGHGFNKTPIYFPELQTDFIYGVFSSNYGLIGSILLIILFIYFDINLINSASKTYDNKDKYTIAGIVSMLVFQQIWSLSMTIGLLPIMGITLPFISYGGSSLLSYMFLVGIIFNVSNQSLRYTN
ncbi:MAG: FtsW/RodA/SpoVE family cell cycle protein [Bacilli bacterium]